MRNSTVKRSVRMTAACLILAAASGLSARPDEGNQLAVAQELLEQGKLVQAKSMLIDLRKSESDPAMRDRILEMLAAADRRLRFVDESELALQKAELAITKGELRVAETHIATARREKLTAEQGSRVTAVETEIIRVRESMAATAPAAIQQAVADFTAGRYAEAKAGFSSILRAGIPLPQEDMATVNTYQDRIYELERQNGRSFEPGYVAMSVAPVASGAASAVAAAATALPQDSGDSGSSAAAAPQAGDQILDEAKRFDAERLTAEAQEAVRAGRYNEAVAKLTQLISAYGNVLTADEISGANDKLAEARALMGAEGQNTLDTLVNRQRVMREEAQAVFENLMSQADASLGRGDVQGARNLAAQARLTVNNAQASGVLSEQEFRDRLARVDSFLRNVDQRAEELTVSEIRNREEQLRTEEQRTRAQQEQERRTRIIENLQRVRALQMEQKYEEALQVLDQVLFLDPTNPAALLLRDVIRDVRLYQEYDQARRDRALSYARESNRIERALIVPDEIMSFPPDWPEISLRRGETQSFVESEADRRVHATLATKRIPASFSDNTIEDVLSFIATVTNLNLDVDWDSLEQIGIERDKQISLELREVPARVVLDRVLEKAQPDEFAKAGWAVNDGVLVIAADEALRRNTFIVIYDVRDLLFQIPDYLDAPELDLDQALQQGGGGGGGGNVFEEEGEDDPAGPTREELLERILEIIQNNVDPRGWEDNGGSTGVVRELNDNLIITNTARNHAEIQSLLNQLRLIRSVQINVESRFLTVASDFFEQIGFDIDIYLNAENDQYRAARRQAAAFGLGSLANEGIALYPTDIVSGVAGGNGQVNTGQVPGYVLGPPDANGDPTYAFNGNNATGQPYSIPAPSPLSIVPIQQGSLPITTSLARSSGTNFSSDIIGSAAALNPALAVAGTFLDDVQVDFLIEATQADRRSVTLSAPRLTIANGRLAWVSVANQRGIISALAPVVGAGSVAFTPTVTPLNTGFALTVQAVASADRRYVTMTVNASVSALVEITSAQVTGAAAAGGTTGTGAATATGTIQIPNIDVTQVKTGVTVPDRGTILLGGQRLSTEVEIESGVPVLSKIPIINRFFTNRAEIREEQTLLILMKPTIIIQSEEEDLAFPGLSDKLRDPFR